MHKNFETCRYPGREDYSYGYEGNGGQKICNDKHEPYGPSFGTGDVIGCGIVDKKCFFTCNGEFLGVAYRGLPLRDNLYPSVGLFCGRTVEGNFGNSPFKFDLDWNTLRTEIATSSLKSNRLFF